MAQVDTSIYGNLLRPVKSVQEYDAEAQQAEGNKLGLLLQRGQYDAQQRGVAEENAFRNALSSGADEKALMAASPTRALAFQEGRAKIAKEQALTTKAAADAKKTDWDAAVAKQAHIAQLASSATDQASWTQARKIAGMLGADISQVPEQFDPATAQHFGQMAMTQAQRLDQAHKEAVLAETTRNNKAQNGIAMRGQDITMRGQNMVDARSREQIAQGGKAPPGYRFKADGSMEAIPGGPADIKAQALAQQKASGGSDVDVALSTLRDAYDRLEQGGGITSTKNGVLGNLAASTSSSAIGQATGRAFGTSNQSARNDIAMSRPALLAAMMKATGMSAKQMDSNAELKLWLATATDPTLDIESNRRALANIERKYLGGGQPAVPQPNPSAPSGLKPGAVDGGYRFKGGNPADKSNWEKVK